jgi:phenylalanyl-tRNA synthetase alpha chain
VALTIERIEAISARWVSKWPTARRSKPTDELHRTEQPGKSPARSMQDTFYVDMKDDEGRWLNLRPHTCRCRCGMRVRTRRVTPALRQCPTYGSLRRAAPTVSTAMPPFADVPPVRRPVDWRERELQDLKAVFTDFCRTFFESDDLHCAFALVLPIHRAVRGDRHRVQQRTAQGQWLEVSARARCTRPWFATSADPERYIGLRSAWGLIVGDAAHGIDDMRLLFDGDLRFLSQFN